VITYLSNAQDIHQKPVLTFLERVYVILTS